MEIARGDLGRRDPLQRVVLVWLGGIGRTAVIVDQVEIDDHAPAAIRIPRVRRFHELMLLHLDAELLMQFTHDGVVHVLTVQRFAAGEVQPWGMTPVRLRIGVSVTIEARACVVRPRAH